MFDRYAIMYLLIFLQMKKNTAYLYLFDLKETKDPNPCELLPSEKKISRPFYQKSRYLIRQVLKKHAIPSDHFYYHPSKKPDLHGPYSISLSHSQDLFLIALMEAECLGADIQIPTLKNETLFREKYGIEDQDLNSLWTKIESYCKATQSSLFRSISSDIDTLIQEKGLFLWQTNDPHPICVVSDTPIEYVELDIEDFTGNDHPV